MIRDHLAHVFDLALAGLVASGQVPAGDYGSAEISDVRDPQHGDYACNLALIEAKKAGLAPRELAQMLVAQVQNPSIEALDIAGPGFINIRMRTEYLGGLVSEILSLGSDLAKTRPLKAMKLNVEFVSVNPNGPITVGSGRGAAFGSALCNVLEAAGHTVHREYYINDGVNSEQMKLFCESVAFFLGELPSMPEGGYKGDYVEAVAQDLRAAGVTGMDRIRAEAERLMIERQKLDLAAFGVRFDTWFSEQSLHESGEVARCLDELRNSGVADEEPYRTELKFGKGGELEETLRHEEPAGALWLRSTRFGDDQDRVLRRADGRLTYIASDVAYHKDKFNRPPGADKLLTILGPDHHGYIGRLSAVVQALGFAKERLEVIIFQLVRFLKEGKPAPMRKRDGNIYALIDLIDEIGQTMLPDGDLAERRRIGSDVARFFYLMRSHDSHMDFDIDLATKQSDENPVFYAQYAHARLCGVLRNAEEQMPNLPLAEPARWLREPKEMALIKKIADLPHEARRCAADYGVHRLTTYAVELARAFHHFYDACRVVQKEQPELSAARLQLCRAAQVGLQGAFALLGVSAPERMERSAP